MEINGMKSECVIWPGCIDDQGRGKTKVFGKHWYAHRLVWTQAFGPIPNGMCICHKCDVPSCINLDHLFLGTLADNNADMNRKGRGVYLSGENAGQAKLTKEQVIFIRSSDLKGVVLSEMFGVGPMQISRIRRGLRWRCVC